MGGAIYGVELHCNREKARFLRVTKIDDLELLRRSKYISSDLHTTFRDVRQDLIEGKMVLFSGLPCQVDGLKRYLNKEYENLLLIDLLCRGANSPLVYSKWLAYCDSSGLCSVNFRNKDLGWKNNRITLSKGNTKVIYNEKVGTFSSLYWSHLILRKSCYNCRYADKRRYGDISLGDFWGLEKIFPDFDDDRGMNAVIINTTQGKVFWEKIVDNVDFRPYDFDAYVQLVGGALKHGVNYPIERDSFWKDFYTKKIHHVIKKYTSVFFSKGS